MCRARVGGFGSSKIGMKRKSSKGINSSSKQLVLTLVFVLFCVNLISSKHLINKEQCKSTNNNDAYAKTTTASAACYVTTNPSNPIDTTK